MKTIMLTFCIVLNLPSISKAQLVVISGYIQNSLSAEGIENVSVFEPNAEIGTITNNKGYYKLILSGGNKEIQYSLDGFEKVSRSLLVKKDTLINIILQPTVFHKNKKNEITEASLKLQRKFLNKRLINK